MTEQYSSRTADKFVVRLVENMRSDIQDIAKEHHRSMNSQIIAWLEMCIAYEKSEGTSLTPQDIAKLLAYIKGEESEHTLAVVPAVQGLPGIGMPARVLGNPCIVQEYFLDGPDVCVTVKTQKDILHLKAEDLQPF